MTSLENLNADFKDLLLSFCSERVEYVIVGAYALAFHGLPRATGDIDILVRPTKDNAVRVRQALLDNKRAAGRTKDLADVEGLEQGRTPPS